LSKDDVKVEIKDDEITIEGERKEEREEKGEGFYRTERSYGHFHRCLPLPEGAEVDKAKASFKNGVLEIAMPIPKREPRRGRRLEIGERYRSELPAGAWISAAMRRLCAALADVGNETIVESDSILKARVIEELEYDPALDAVDIRVEATDDVVTLRGTVPVLVF
jgi:hypothetical protein